MIEDNRGLQELIGMLAMVHRELQRKTVLDAAAAGAIADTHFLTRRLIAQQEIRTPEDIRLLLRAAEMAQGVDPRFADDETGSALDLLRRAVAAIEKLHSGNRQEANSMLSAILPPRR